MQIEDTEIRFAKTSDAYMIASMSKSLIEYDMRWRYTPEKICSIIKNKEKNLVISKTDEKLSGFGIMTYYSEQANLDLLAVLPEYQRNYIGTKIVKWLEEVAMTAGIYNIFVQVREINSEAINFYKNLGFIVIDKKAKYYNNKENGIILSKSLRQIYNAT